MVLLAISVLNADTYSSEWVKNIPDANEQLSVFYGPTKIIKKTMEDLTVYGPAYITSSNITATTTIKGPVDASHTTFKNLNIDGIAKLDDVKVTGQLVNNGPVFAYNSTIEKMSVQSLELTLSNTKVDRLFVRINNNYPVEQRIYIEKGSEVNSVIFESKQGRIVPGDATVSVKHIEGGKMDGH